MSYKNIKIEITGGIAVLTLNRPEVRNALDFETWEEIRSGMRELGRREGVQVIIFTGAGGKAFASGTDIRAIHDRTVAEQMNSEVSDTLYEISTHKRPVIAAIDGYALGGGCELAMACDIRQRWGWASFLALAGRSGSSVWWASARPKSSFLPGISSLPRRRSGSDWWKRWWRTAR